MDNIDLLKSSPCEDQMEMLMFMMQMESEMPMLDYSPRTNSNNNNNNTDRNNFSEIIDHRNTPSTFLNNMSSSTISFNGSPHQMVHQESSITLPFLDNSSRSNGKWRSTSSSCDYKEQVSNTTHLSTFLSHTSRNSMEAMREMIFRIAAMQPIQIDPSSIKAPKRRNVKISSDPQSVAARHRRERISEKIRILQRLVPGGTKMDTASMLEEAIHYMKFLKKQVQSLEKVEMNRPVTMSLSGNYLPNYYPYHQSVHP